MGGSKLFLLVLVYTLFYTSPNMILGIEGVGGTLNRIQAKNHQRVTVYS